MDIIESAEQMRARVTQLRQQGRRIGFVPTMGNLHAGHIHLVAEARRLADVSVVSIFVNPLQFGPLEDFERYPRTLADDSEKLVSAGNDILFIPSAGAIYPRPLNLMSRIEVPQLGEVLCGQSRPGHFTGVCTVVAKLFNIVAADVACFGEKDYQQLLIIRRMVEDLDFPIRIYPVATQRETDGLALSSRNQYLSPVERQIAPALYRCLQVAKQAVMESDSEFRLIEDLASQTLASAGFAPEYVSIRDGETLQPGTRHTANLRIFAAAKLGQTRLIDNILCR